jgi:hypothetical protein
VQSSLREAIATKQSILFVQDGLLGFAKDNPENTADRCVPKEKRAGRLALLQKLCRPFFPENLDLILIGGVTLLVRARVPPETWTTRLRPCDLPEAVLVDHLFRPVIIFGNDCSKLKQFAK